MKGGRKYQLSLTLEFTYVRKSCHFKENLQTQTMI